MAIARVFKSGNSQAVRLPKKFRIKTKELEIEKRGNAIILREKPVGMERAFYFLTELVNLDALKNRKDDKPQKRKGLCWKPDFCWTPTFAGSELGKIEWLALQGTNGQRPREVTRGTRRGAWACGPR